MQERKFSRKEALNFGWQVMKKNFWLLVGIFLIAGLFYFLPSAIAEATKKKILPVSVIFNIIYIIVSYIVQMGMMGIALKLCDGERVKINDLFAYTGKFFKYLAASILYGLIVLGGTILLVVPGIIWGIRFGLYGYAIVDKDIGPISALKLSSKITYGAKWDLAVFGLFVFGINLLGILCLILGLFATLPATMIASAFVFRQLEKSAHGA